ncbi:MAG: hypothetical protein CEN88_299 [Candidatus Berkelbacteria bacterium Licking1014_2]|uniref:Response regulatory domain-containing protein n=1 Tax=Candidatus Berkelbacteria bacterium Licking1014_2 TaxID=2017146 RepID=A0A554LUS2_9BACT|nr:MAG: hypothetical protein CEN88_299 [Candidatus Berkelbacteria bacterium Licking1014_2]
MIYWETVVVNTTESLDMLTQVISEYRESVLTITTGYLGCLNHIKGDRWMCHLVIVDPVDMADKDKRKNETDPLAVGKEFLRELLSIDFPPPVLIITSESSAEFRQFCLDAGVAGYLTTPFSPETFRREIVRIFNLSPADPQ